MATKIPWQRALLEGLVIVGSILLAFAIDAWWDGRQQRALEAQYLDALREEMTTNQASIQRIRGYHNLRIEAFDAFLESTPRELNAVPEDSARAWIPNLVYSATIPLARSVVGSGESGLVEDPQIRRAISAWMSAADGEGWFPGVALPSVDLLDPGRDSRQVGVFEEGTVQGARPVDESLTS